MIFVRNRYLCILALSLAMAGCAVDPVPNEQLRLSEQAVAQARAAHPVVATGQFAADMQVHLVNDGPVTIPLRMAPLLDQK